MAKKKKHTAFDWVFPLAFTLIGLGFFGPGFYMARRESEFREHAIAYPGFLVNADPFHKARAHNHPPVLVRYVKPDGDVESTFVKQHYNGQYRSGDSLPILINETLRQAEVGGRSAWFIPVVLMVIGTVFFAAVASAVYLLYFL